METATSNNHRNLQQPEPGILRVGLSEIGGRGVFACSNLRADVLIEIAPVIIRRGNQANLVRQTLLYNYFFRWGESLDSLALCLGFASLYNHSDQPNVAYTRDVNQESLRFCTVRKVSSGEELFVDPRINSSVQHA